MNSGEPLTLGPDDRDFPTEANPPRDRPKGRLRTEQDRMQDRSTIHRSRACVIVRDVLIPPTSTTDPVGRSWQKGVLTPASRRAALITVGVVYAIGIIELLGWATGTGSLANLAEEWPRMTPWTIVMAFLLGTAVAVLALLPPRTRSVTSRVLAAVAGTAAALFLLEYLTGVDLGIDTVFFGDEVTAAMASLPGRPSPQTALVSLGLAVALLAPPRPRWLLRAMWGAGLIVASAVVPFAIGGYLFNAPTIVAISYSTGIAVSAAVALGLVIVALILIHPSRPPISWLALLPDPVSFIRVVSAVVVIPVVIWILRGAAVALGTTDNAAWVLSIGITVILVAVALFRLSLGEQRVTREQLHLASQLRDFADRYRLIATHSTDVVSMVTSAGQITWISPSCQDMFGFTPDDLVGELALDLVDDEHRTHFADVLAARDSEESSSLVVHGRRLAGPGRWLHVIAAPVSSAEGTSDWIVTWRDIDAEERAKAELARSEQHYRVLAQNVTDVVFTLDATGVVTWLSPSAASVLGWETRRVVGRPLAEQVLVDDSVHFARLLEGVRREGGSQRITVRVRRTGQDDAWTYLTVSRPAAPSTDTAALTGSLVIIDELVEQERIALERQLRLESVLDSIMDSLIVLSPIHDDSGTCIDFAFTEVNAAAARFYGTERSQLLDTTVMTLHPSTRQTDLIARYDHALRFGTPVVLDDWAFPQDLLNGQIRWFDLRAMPSAGQIVVSWRDRTDEHERRAAMDKVVDARQPDDDRP